MIALYFGIPLNQVEELPIVDYRLMLFTVFNNAILNSMDASNFKFLDESEEDKMLEADHKKLFPEKYN